MGILRSSRRMIQAERWRYDLAYGGIAAAYADKVLGYGPIAYWPLWETAGLTAECLVNSPAQDGTYTGVTLANGTAPDGSPCPLFDGANDYVDVLTAAFIAAFNGAVGTLVQWQRVFNVGVWTDATTRYPSYLFADGANSVSLWRRRGGFNDQLYSQRSAGGGAEFQAYNTTTTAWFHSAITWNHPADEVKYYVDGIQVLPTDAGLVAWAGNLVTAIIGSRSLIPNDPWYGWISHVAPFDTVLTQPQILDIATPTP